MKAINIVSLVNAKKDLSDFNFQAYIQRFGLNPKMRATELADVATLIEQLQAIGAQTSHFNDFFVGYSIHQISKEFDLLRIGKNFILNIELKLESSEERIEKQLIQNAHYLRFLNIPVYNYTFVTQTKKVYKLEGGHLQQTQLQELFGLMLAQDVEMDVSIEELFDPIHYLVSPIDEPVSFMNEEYFLTAQQTTFKMEIMNREQHFRRWFALEGGPGTGKTLLTYDIAKEYMSQGQSVTVLHCRPLQQGQRTLIEQFGWDIVDIHDWFEEEHCDVLIIDEAHHLTKSQLQQLLIYEQQFQPKVIISYDPQHYFNGSEIISELESRVKLIRFELKVIIRYNKEIHTFINCLFDMSYTNIYPNYKSISVQYFSEIEAAEQYLKNLQEHNWKVINVISDMKFQELAITNDIIGQEFDYVVALMDQHFYYKTNMRLSCYGIDYTYEQPTKVLFQALTRTRKKLQLVIVNNESLLQNVLSILQSR